MTSIDIYAILASKPHNPHYLRRYWKFILNCVENFDEAEFSEKHHICPKAKDLFPEYDSFVNYPWNKAKLTSRQHYIAHIILHKAYGGSQTNAVWYMSQISRYKNIINSKQYETIRREYRTSMMGTQYYKNKDGNVYRVSTKHEKVLSGELKHIQCGKTYSDEYKKRMSEKNKGRIFTEEHMLNMKQGTKKYRETNPIVSQETRDKIRKSKTGSLASTETKTKMSEQRKDSSIYISIDGTRKRLNRDDHRVISGEYKLDQTLRRTIYKNYLGVSAILSKDDSRVISGEYVGVRTKEKKYVDLDSNEFMALPNHPNVLSGKWFKNHSLFNSSSISGST